MKKKLLIAIVPVIICIIGVSVYNFCLTSNGDTIESRENILNKAISSGNDWTIAKEIELDGYIISGAYSTDNKSTLATDWK